MELDQMFDFREKRELPIRLYLDALRLYLTLCGCSSRWLFGNRLLYQSIH
jgi:hypothetical protein